MKKLKTILLINKYNILLIIVIVFALLISKTYQSKFKGNEKEIIGNIKQIVVDGDKLSMIINSKEKIVVNYFFKTEEEKNSFDLELNDEIKVSGSIIKPNMNSVFNTFNYEEYLRINKIYYIFNANRIELVKKNNNILYKIKNYMYKRNEKMISKDYISVFLFGDKSQIESDSYETYNNIGIIHLFSISGMHISFFILILKKIKLNKTIIPFLLFYSFLVGFQISILRSLFMYILKQINKKYNFNITDIDLLKICGVILLIMNPLYIYNIGFQFTFIITYGIYKYKDYLNIYRLPLIIFLCSLPIIINNYYSVNLISIISNIILVPIVTYIIFPLSLLTYIFPFLDSIFNFIISFFNHMCKIINSFDLLRLSFSKIPIILVLLYYFLLFNNKKKLVLLMIIIFYFFNYYIFNPKIYFIDVGQGDSSLIRINNKNVLIDTGGKQSIEKEEWQQRKKEYKNINNSIMFFKSIGVKKLDYLIITHGDYDHMGDSINLVNNFKVEKVIFNCGELNNLEKELIEVLNRKNIEYDSCIKELNINNNKLYFLQTKEYDNENDNSNVIYTELNGYKFMFMGDAGLDKEKDILQKYNISNIDVLKVGHHGSKTSSSKEFIDEINPKYSIISVGKNNRYGHPNKEVLNNLRESKIYRTDQDGSIMFKIKNNKLKIETCSP